MELWTSSAAGPTASFRWLAEGRTRLVQLHQRGGSHHARAWDARHRSRGLCKVSSQESRSPRPAPRQGESAGVRRTRWGVIYALGGVQRYLDARRRPWHLPPPTRFSAGVQPPTVHPFPRETGRTVGTQRGGAGARIRPRPRSGLFQPGCGAPHSQRVSHAG